MLKLKTLTYPEEIVLTNIILALANISLNGISKNTFLFCQNSFLSVCYFLFQIILFLVQTESICFNVWRQLTFLSLDVEYLVM